MDTGDTVGMVFGARSRGRHMWAAGGGVRATVPAAFSPPGRGVCLHASGVAESMAIRAIVLL